MKFRIRRTDLPLAVYREVAAHLCQVDGVEVELVPQQSQQFDYRLSQIDSLEIQYPDNLNSACSTRIKQILAYYSDRYGAWETVEFDTVESGNG
ncbi:MAG: hypothetical protein WCA35_23935 [Kovacikia sp.]